MFGKKIENLRKLQKEQFPVPDFMIADKDTVEEIPWDLCAVRSASCVEDGEADSFAGQFDTYLNVPKEEVPDKIQACFASMEKESVRLYAKEKGIDISSVGMHVIVQEMIRADYSGVCFTANPQGLLNEMVIVAGRGTGDGVVEDKVDTTAYYYNTTDGIYYYEGKEDYLSPDMVEQMVKLATRMKPLLGQWLDIEFAIKDGYIYILQARNITTLKDDTPLILDNSNIVESYPGISLPLTCSFVNTVYGGVFRSVSRRVLKDKKELAKHDTVFGNMVGHVNGRIYYKISNWYTVIKFLPMNHKIIPIWQDMMGVKIRNYDEGAVELSKWLRFKTYWNVITEMLLVPRNMKRLNRDFIKMNDEFYEKYHDEITPEELLVLYKDLQTKLLACWDVTLLNDIYAFVFTGMVKKRMGAASNQVISGISNMESLKPVREMIWLARNKQEMSEEEYRKAFEGYIQDFGDRHFEELKLESKTFRSNPELLEEKLIRYNEDKDKLESMYETFYGDGKGDAGKKQTTGGFINGILIKEAARGIANREISRLNRSRIYGMVRLLYTRIGEVFAEDNLIGGKEDIFWLTEEEIWAVTEHRANGKEYRKLIETRKEEYELYAHLPAYQRLIFADKEFHKRHQSINAHPIKRTKEKLSGIPCSDGIAEGEVLVITDVTKVTDYRDKILVTKMTDPGWVFLLVTAKGIISEKGSLLSHTAIISRELHIPSVVGVEGAMHELQTGDLVRMNGTTGEIEKIKR